MRKQPAAERERSEGGGIAKIGKTEFFMENKESNFVRILTEICEEEAIALTTYSDAWVFALERNGRRGYIFGYQFGLNSAASAAVCNDKCTTYEILSAAGVAAVPHFCFMSPADMKYVGKDGCFVELTRLLEQYGSLVVKDNEGTGGKSVCHVRTRTELEHAVIGLFSYARSLAVSPYLEIEEEYRVVVLDGEVKIIFSKQRPRIVGDGSSTVRELTAEAVRNGALDSTGEVSLGGQAGEQVLAAGEPLYFSWRHNLGQGAYAQVLRMEPKSESGAELQSQTQARRAEEALAHRLGVLALRAADAVGVRFASVDIVSVGTTTGAGEGAGGSGEQPPLRVLEINSGVMMENLAGESAALYARAKEIYAEAVRKMLGAVE